MDADVGYLIERKKTKLTDGKEECSGKYLEGVKVEDGGWRKRSNIESTQLYG